MNSEVGSRYSPCFLLPPFRLSFSETLLDPFPAKASYFILNETLIDTSTYYSAITRNWLIGIKLICACKICFLFSLLLNENWKENIATNFPSVLRNFLNIAKWTLVSRSVQNFRTTVYQSILNIWTVFSFVDFEFLIRIIIFIIIKIKITIHEWKLYSKITPPLIIKDEMKEIQNKI